jgi:hypothetical protein
MSSLRKILVICLFGIFGVSVPCMAQEQPGQAGTLPNLPGRDVLMGRCLQCHGTGMWKDHRQDQRGWEGVLYRMVGRGALWTEEEIRIMSGYLAAAYGPQAGKPGK